MITIISVYAISNLFDQQIVSEHFYRLLKFIEWTDGTEHSHLESALFTLLETLHSSRGGLETGWFLRKKNNEIRS